MKRVQLHGLGRPKLRLQLTKKCFIRFYKSSLINQWSSFKHLLGSASIYWQIWFVSFDSFVQLTEHLAICQTGLIE